MYRKTIVLVLSLVLPWLALADRWPLPKKKTYCSNDGAFCVEVIPRPIASQLDYFSDRAEGKALPGQLPGANQKECRALLFRQTKSGKRTRIWSAKLVNDVAPVHALVSNDGRFVVTFDNWHRLGYGDDVVVLYGPEGQLIRKFSLEDLLGEDAANAPRSVGSRRWWDDESKHYIDEGKLEVVLRAAVLDVYQVQIDRTPVQVIPQDRKRRHEIRIQLTTGQITGR